MQIWLSGFSAEDLENKYCFRSCRRQADSNNRKGSGNSSGDIEDNIAFLEETEPEKLPIFVTRDLNKLPPESFDYKMWLDY